MKIGSKIISNETEFKVFSHALQEAKLPVEDLSYQNQILITYFLGETLVGTGGLEVMGKLGLLRSISVEPSHRNKKIGKEITKDILMRAKESELDSVYLLTETAKGFFSKVGFEEISRSDAPAEIKSTTEFAHVCPDTAVLMMIHLNQ